MKQVILVDENDTETGTEEKIEAHRKGLLHRAFSVLIFDGAGHMLLQRRAEGKYHSGGLWTNTCCSHPQPGEDTLRAASERLWDEMGIICTLQEQFSFMYKAHFDNGITEHEYDHVFTGEWIGVPVPDPDEVMDWKWAALPELKNDIDAHPEDYTVWFREIMKRDIFN